MLFYVFFFKMNMVDIKGLLQLKKTRKDLYDHLPIVELSYTASNKLLNRIALVTGGDSGIGRSVAVMFAMEGADIAIVYHESMEEKSLHNYRCLGKSNSIRVPSGSLGCV